MGARTEPTENFLLIFALGALPRKGGRAACPGVAFQGKVEMSMWHSGL